eukprot:TRINITY_DN2361_c0_g1_i1.p1 TRINITY_DN2361_c0_g1~~TRINITY_DN2361_c0_g1_i1.p1  ORF type:complete len:395 (+),score=97.57 TRINITY_DN2361_c0_g1_i1:94-1185(+)
MYQTKQVMGKKKYDFRSDTVTVPTEPMLKAMMEAEVGDDVKNEDPTVHKLQEKVAQLCGKEAALFVCSGNLSNQLAIRTHITNGFKRETVVQSVVSDYRSHVFKYELGGIAFHSNVQVYPIRPASEGEFITAEVLKGYINQANDLHTPVTTLVCLENTQNGRVFPIEEIKKIREMTNALDIRLHLDGARLWNASIATGISFEEYCKYFDSISLCLSKGMGAPIGSVLVGDKAFIEKARQYRKLFGGGWRQAGNLAAAGMYAIDHHWQKLKTDHENAKTLWKGMIELGFEGDEPQTNMVWLSCKKLNTNWETLIQEMHKKQKDDEDKLLVDGSGWETRFVLHHQLEIEGVHKLIRIMKEIVQKQ